MKRKTDPNSVEDCIKKFCNDLTELATEMIDYKEKEIIPPTEKEINLYERQKVCHICKGSFCYDKNKKANMIFIIKSEITVTTLGNLEELLIIFAI